MWKERTQIVKGKVTDWRGKEPRLWRERMQIGEGRGHIMVESAQIVEGMGQIVEGECPDCRGKGPDCGGKWGQI